MGWQGKDPADLEKTVEEGGVWTGGEYEKELPLSGTNKKADQEGTVYSASIDSFPFVGPVPGKPGQFVAAGFAGHG